MRAVHRLLGFTSIALMATPAFAAETISDPSFESPALAHGTLAYNPVTPGATFNTGSGIAANGSAFGFLPAPDGNQVAFLQSYGNYVGSFSLTLAGLTAGALYTVGFDAALRPGYDANPFTVSFNGISLGTFSPTSTGWSEFITSGFNPTGSTGVLTFTGSSTTGDNDVAIDALRLNPITSAVPEPASWFLMLLGFGLVAAASRKRRLAAFSRLAIGVSAHA